MDIVVSRLLNSLITNDPAIATAAIILNTTIIQFLVSIIRFPLYVGRGGQAKDPTTPTLVYDQS